MLRVIYCFLPLRGSHLAATTTSCIESSIPCTIFEGAQGTTPGREGGLVKLGGGLLLWWVYCLACIRLLPCAMFQIEPKLYFNTNNKIKEIKSIDNKKRRRSSSTLI
jgi:hypothetical protein